MAVSCSTATIVGAFSGFVAVAMLNMDGIGGRHFPELVKSPLLAEHMRATTPTFNMNLRRLLSYT